MKHNLVTLVVKVILEDTAAFQVLFVVSLFFCLKHHYCGDQQWRSITSGCLGLKNLVLFTSPRITSMTHALQRGDVSGESIQVHPRNPSILGNDDLNHKCKLLS